MPGAAIVTGHTRGLGEAIADTLLTRGFRVLGLARGVNLRLDERHRDKLRQDRLDLSDPQALITWLGAGHLEGFLGDATSASPMVLVNNAGLLSPVGPLETQDPAAVATTIGVNVAAVLMLSAGFARATREHPDRRILHISSGAASRPYAGWSVYCATKAALDMHARAVQEDDSPGLRIAAVAPGVIDTEMQTQIRGESEANFPDKPRFVQLKQQGQLRAPADAARELVELLLSARFGTEPVTDLRR